MLYYRKLQSPMWKAPPGEEYVFKIGTEVDFEEDGGDPSLSERQED